VQQKGFTPLHIAAKYGNVPISKILLSKGASPNAEGKNGLTPLHVATHYNSVEVAQLLTENKANPHAAAKVSIMPIMWHCSKHSCVTANVLSVPRSNLSFGSCAFRTAAVTVWNSLPPHVRSCTTLITFRKHLKSHLFQSSFTTA